MHIITVIIIAVVVVIIVVVSSRRAELSLRPDQKNKVILRKTSVSHLMGKLMALKRKVSCTFWEFHVVVLRSASFAPNQEEKNVQNLLYM